MILIKHVIFCHLTESKRSLSDIFSKTNQHHVIIKGTDVLESVIGQPEINLTNIKKSKEMQAVFTRRISVSFLFRKLELGGGSRPLARPKANNNL